MTTVSTSVLVNSIADLLTEAYAGPPDPTTTWFIDNEPDSGIFGILRGVTAQEASYSVDGSGRTGTTIASHAEHLRWSLASANAALRGQPYTGRWSESWGMVDLDEEHWNRLRSDLRAEFVAVREAMTQQKFLPEEYLKGVLALLPHVAYHLGNIRQMVERTREMENKAR